jgi:hypothetical protein
LREEGRRKKEEGRRKKEEGRSNFPYHLSPITYPEHLTTMPLCP